MNVAGRSYQKAELSAVVIRADGRREDLGVIASWRAPWWKRLWARIFR